MNKTVLLTGANGFLGSHLVPELVKNNFRVLCLLRSQKGLSAHDRLRKALESVCHGGEDLSEIMSCVDAVEGSIEREDFGLDERKLDALAQQVDHVLHCAAMTTFLPHLSKEQWKANVQGTDHIARFVLRCSPRDGLHYVSTAYVAGDRKDLVYEDELDKGQGFLSGYEKSKFHAEKLLHQYQKEHNLKITTYRPGIIVGDSESGRTVLFNGVYLFVRFFQVAKQSVDDTCQGKVVIPVRCLGNPEVPKNFVQINYVVNTIARLFMLPKAHGATYHITHDNPPKLGELGDVMQEVLNIEGLEFVEEEAFRESPATELETILMEQIGVYAPYLRSEPSFDKGNIKKVLSEDAIPQCPPMDHQALEKLFCYAIESNWGRKRST